MLPRSLRLSRAGFEKSRRLSRTTTLHFSISYGPLPNDAGIGVIVPKKIVKSSVGRHRLKRRVREIVRELVRGNDTSRTIVISARAGAATLTFDDLHDELSAAFRAILPGNA